MEQQTKMVNKIKMAANHEFSIAQSIFLQINGNLGFGKNVIEKKNCKRNLFFENFKWWIKSKSKSNHCFFLALTQSFLNRYEPILNLS
jgi:hypothetical protein